MKSITRARSRGFSILEVQMTMAVLLLGILGLSGAMYVSNRTQSTSRERLVVARSLSNVLEEVGETDFSLIQSQWDGVLFEIPGVESCSPTTNPLDPLLYPDIIPTDTSEPCAGEVRVVTVDSRRLQVFLAASWSSDQGAESFSLFQEFSQ